VAERYIHPALVGNDIGCGIGLWTTGLTRVKAKGDRWVRGLRAGMEGTVGEQLGTVGGGNHFAELSVVDEVFDTAALEALGLGAGALVVLVHSGSRGLGERVLRDHFVKHGVNPLSEGSPEAVRYLEQHEAAVVWARANREAIALRFLNCIGAVGVRVADVCHNSVSRVRLSTRDVWLHRKGAAPTDEGPVVVAGSRGTRSYLVLPVGDGERSAWSLAHGAGRKWARGDAKARLKDRYTAGSLERTPLGGVVICDDRDLLYEEAPQAYKAIDQVIGDMRRHGLIQLVAALAPMITYKVAGREEP
jgi:release factor H-coupled RctB family protein